MSTYLGLLDESIPSSRPNQNQPPWRIFAFLLAMVFTAEVVSMVIIYFLQLPNYVVVTLVDGLIMVALIFPGLYYLQLKPLLNEISERTLTESILRNTDKLLSKVLELLPVGVWITDKNGKIIHGNPASQGIWAGARFVGSEQYGEYKGWWLDSGKLIDPEEWAGYRAIHHGETSLNEEIEIESFDGARKYILNSAVPIQDETGAIQGAIIVNQDITQRLTYEDELVKSNELLEKYFLTIDTHIAYLDPNFNFIRVNDTYAKSGGYPPEYFIGKNHFDLYPHTENQAIFQQVVETGEPYIALEKPFEYPEFPERGTTFWDWSLHPVRGTKGEIEGLVLSLVDVTERKQAELQLERQNEELRELSQAERVNRELAEGLVQATIAVNSYLELDQVLGAILKQIRKTIGFQSAGILLVEGKSLRLASHLGLDCYPTAIQSLKQFNKFEEFTIISQVISSQQPIMYSSKDDFPVWDPLPGLEWMRSIIVAPLIHSNTVTGIIILASDQYGAYSRVDKIRLTAFAAPAALAIHNAQLYKAELTARHASEKIRTAIQSLTRTLNMDHVIQTLLDHITRIVHADIVGITFIDDLSHKPEQVLRGYGQFEQEDELRSFPIEVIHDFAVQEVIASRKSKVIPSPDLDRSPLLSKDGEYIQYWMVIPLTASDKLIGIVEVGTANKESFNPEHVHWAEALVGQAGVAIQNAWLFEQVRASSERLQSLARKLVEVQEHERNHISRELHDEAGQALSSLKLSLGRLERDPDCPKHMRPRLLELKTLVDHVLEELHRLAMDLRPVTLDHLGLMAALEQLANKLSSDQLSVRFKAFGFKGERLSPALETTLYRIAQEALTNTIRYAQASDVGILIKMEDAKVKIFIEDNGIGFDPENVATEGHIGLVGMRERAEMVGGTLTIESAPGRGTSIILEVPDDHSHPDR